MTVGNFEQFAELDLYERSLKSIHIKLREMKLDLAITHEVERFLQEKLVQLRKDAPPREDKEVSKPIEGVSK